MRLTSKDYQSIAKLIEVGRGSIEYTKDGEVLFIDYDYDEEGYVEDDYLNGTGGYVVTGRSLIVEAAESYDSEGEATENDFCENQLCKMVA